MFADLKFSEQKNLIERCLKKAGSERKLAKSILMPNCTVYFYKKCLRKISKERYIKLLQFLDGKVNIEIELKKVNFLPNDFGQKRGGIMSYKIKVKNGTFGKNLEKMKKASSKKLSEWHKNMERKNKKQYFITQYERFRKTGQYKFITKRGERVRNKLEKEVADFLFDLKKSYLYEPYIESNGKTYFPDFLVENKIIIECTMWRNYDKAVKLKEKISNFEKSGFKVIITIDPKITKFYKSIKDYTIDNLISLKDILDRPDKAPICCRESSVGRATDL